MIEAIIIVARDRLYRLSNYLCNTTISPLPLTGEGLGGGDHPPLNPLPSREGKWVVGSSSGG
jgi:hypothetical protein